MKTDGNMLTSSYLKSSGAAVSNCVYTNCADDQLLANNDAALHRQISVSGSSIEYPWMKEKKTSSNKDIRRQRARDEYGDLVLLQSTPAGKINFKRLRNYFSEIGSRTHYLDPRRVCFKPNVPRTVTSSENKET
jgi:hypothetical protein